MNIFQRFTQWLSSLFTNTINPQILNHGLILEFKVTDYQAGTETGSVLPSINPSGDWTPYITANDPQSDPIMDTMACTSFSATHNVEIIMNWMKSNNKFNADKLKWLSDNGYINTNGKVELSERFLAKMSGTTQIGNSFQNVWDAIRKYGMLPLSDWAFTQDMNWNTFYEEIPQNLKDKALGFLNIVDINYQWVVPGTTLPLNKQEILTYLTQSPLQVAIPIPCYHAVTMVRWATIYDHYAFTGWVYTVADNYPVNYVIQPIIKVHQDLMNTTQKVATLTRTSDNGKETLGTLTCGTFSCKTLELPWLNNQINISCIPKGTYQCIVSYFKGMNIVTYEILSVPERVGNRIHPANYVSQLEGCIAIGNAFQDINGDGQLDVINSRATFAQFMSYMGGQPFTLIIQ